MLKMESPSINVTVLLLISTLLLVANCYESGSVFFIDAQNRRYFRPSIHDSAQVDSFSPLEVSAALSVLLGFKPTETLSASSSTKLNDVLIPNPFERPRSVLFLEVSGVSDSAFATVESISSLRSAIKRNAFIDSDNVQIELPSEDIFMVSIDAESSDFTDEHLSEFALWFGGSYNNVDGDGELILPLSGGKILKLKNSENADRKFALNLVALFNNVKMALEAHSNIPHDIQRPAELLMGCFNGIEVLRTRYGSVDIINHGMEALLLTFAKSFESLQAAFKDEIVGVVLLKNSVQAKPEKLITVTLTSHPSARTLAEVSLNAANSTDSKTELARRTLAWVTGIILLIATFMGIYMLMYMPLTRDTLLYSNVKLD